MRHDVERYRMLLEGETNPRVRKLLTGMIEELESRATATDSPEVENPPVVRATERPIHFFPL